MYTLETDRGLGGVYHYQYLQEWYPYRFPQSEGNRDLYLGQTLDLGELNLATLVDFDHKRLLVLPENDQIRTMTPMAVDEAQVKRVMSPAVLSPEVYVDQRHLTLGENADYISLSVKDPNDLDRDQMVIAIRRISKQDGERFFRLGDRVVAQATPGEGYITSFNAYNPHRHPNPGMFVNVRLRNNPSAELPIWLHDLAHSQNLA